MDGKDFAVFFLTFFFLDNDQKTLKEYFKL